jgi:hypothetical protein
MNMLLHYQGHTEHVTFAVMCLGKENMILGLPWLKEHNLEINWTTGPSVASTGLVKSKLQKSWLLKLVQAGSSQCGDPKYMINIVNSLV